MMININKMALDKLDSMLITEQYETLLKVASQIQIILTQERTSEYIQLAKQVRDKILELRFIMSVKKVSDGVIDNKLKKAWESINALLGSD